MTHPCRCLISSLCVSRGPRYSHLLALTLALSGCLSFPGRRNQDPPESSGKHVDDAPLDAHVARLRRGVAKGEIPAQGWPKGGVIPRDLSVPEGDLGLAPHDNDGFHGVLGTTPLSSLKYAGMTGDRVCFITADFPSTKPESSEELPAAEAARQVKADLATHGIWVEAVDSLDALEGRRAWPPGPASVQISTVEVVSDKKLTTTSKKAVGGGAYIDVKTDTRHLTLKVCAPKVIVTRATQYLVVVAHHPPVPGDEQLYDPNDESYEKQYGPGWKLDIPLQHNALFVWALTDDGKFDPSK